MGATFEESVHEVVASLRTGEVTTYGEVAAEAGHPGAARAVGTFLRRHGGDLPWWRIVTASGRLAPGREVEQARRLRAEGVETEGTRVRMAPLTRPDGRHDDPSGTDCGTDGGGGP